MKHFHQFLENIEPAPGYVHNIEKRALENNNFRTVIFTAQYCQLVVMSIPVDESIGVESHGVDQFFRVEQGTGLVQIGRTKTQITPGSGIIVPAGTEHNIINTGNEPLKLYTIYSPPKHRYTTVHKTKADSKGDTETFDGLTDV